MLPVARQVLSCFALFSSLALPAAAAPHFAAIDLRCEYRRSPAGIDVVQPRLSWRMSTDNQQARGVAQTGYRILVASSAEQLARHNGDLWDSGRVTSDASTQIEYSGKPLSSGAQAYWSVQIWNEKGKSSDWSEPARWSMGLLTETDWGGAEWIGLEPQGPPPSDDNRVLPARLFRKEFTAPSKIRRATVYLSGLGLSELYCNGKKIGDDVLSPGLTDYDKRALYVTYDVTDQLRAGKNALGIQLGNGRYFAPRIAKPLPGRTFGYPKAKLLLTLEDNEGIKTTVVSDATWTASDQGPIRANNEYDGEDYDATAEIPGWAEPDFAQTWAPAQLVPAPAGRLAAQMAEPLRVMEHRKPVTIRQLGPGVFIADMGQNMVGWCRLTVAGPRGTVVVLRHAETLQPDGNLYVANLRSARATDHYTLRGQGTEVYQPRFTYHGFRYVEITGFPGTPTVDSLEGEVVHDAMEPAGTFETSDQMLNQLHHNLFWGIRGNYRSIPTDCPQRDERQGWLGDRSVVSRSETFFFNVAAFYTKWSTDLQDAQNSAGGMSDVVPTYWPLYNEDVTWPSTFVQIPALLYDQYGDRRVIAERYAALQRWIDHTNSFLKDGLLTKDTYGDWCVPPEDPKLIHSKDPARRTDGALLSTAYLFWMNHQMERFARILGKESDADRYRVAQAQLKTDFNNSYLNREQGWYGNNTQTANILPLAFGMVPDELRAKVLTSLVDNIRNRSNNHVATGLVGVQWLMRTLSENGYPDLALQIATQPTYPGWGYMITKGATTVWELWNGDTADPAMNSGNHVMQMGDLGLWMYEDLAGIRSDPEHPGFQHTLIAPVTPQNLTYVRASHQTQYGNLASAWQRSANGLTLDITIPPNTTATVALPATSSSQVQEGGKVIAKSTAVQFLRADGQRQLYRVASGTYRFQVSANLQQP